MELINEPLFSKLKLNWEKNGTLQNICRICFTCLLGESQISNANVKNISLVHYYEELTSIIINSDYSSPMNFCSACVLEIENCHKFRKKCINAELMLQAFYKKTNQEIKVIVEVNEAINNNLELEAKNGGEIKQEDVENDSQVYEVQFLEESSLEPDEYINFAVLTHKKINSETKSTTKDVTRAQPNTKRRRKTRGRLKLKEKPTIDIATRDTITHERDRSVETKPCLLCKKIFYNDNDLNIHMSLHVHNQPWVCNVCNKEHKDKNTLRRHISRHMRVKPYKCRNCDKSFCEITDLKRHMRVHTGEIVEKKRCFTCKKTFPSRGALEAHRPCPGQDGRRWSCWCGRQLASQRLLDSHQRVHSDDKPHACPHCHKRFRHDSTLTTHLRTHTGERPYMCTVCGKTFIQGCNLKLHMRRHSGVKPYSCTKCPRKFTSSSALKTHELCHSDTKHDCELCGKTLSLSSLAAHRRGHAAAGHAAGHAAGRAGCGLCPRTFSSAAALRRHALLHSGEKPFECKICLKKFPSKIRLDRHSRLIHITNVKSEKDKEKLIKNENNTITGTDYKFVNKIQIQDMTDIENKLEIVHSMDVSGELVLQADGETEAELKDTDDNVLSIPADAESNDNIKLIAVKDEINVSETVVECGTIKLVKVNKCSITRDS